MEKADVLVIGGGPAGLAAAIGLARRGLEVRVVEAGRYTGWRVGETLMAEGRVALEKLGAVAVLDQGPHFPAQAVYSVWGGERPAVRDSIFNPYGTGWHLDRARFDRDLAAFAEGVGVAVCRGCRVAAWMRRGDRWEVAMSSMRGGGSKGRGGGGNGEEPLGVSARFLVDATGRRAWLAKAMKVAWRRSDQLTAVVGLLSPEKGQPESEPVLMIEAVEGGWWYSAAQPGGKLVAAYLTDEDLLRGGDEKRDKADVWFDRIRESRYTGGRVSGFALRDVRVRSACSGCLESAAGPGWVAVGDAACAYDPLSGQGLTAALESGEGTAEAVVQGLIHGSLHNATVLEGYAGSVRRRYEGYLKVRQAYYEMERRWPQSEFWRRRSGAGGRVGVETG